MSNNGTSFKTHPTDPSLYIVSFYVEGWCWAEVHLPITTPLNKLEEEAVKRMESIRYKENLNGTR